MTPNDRDSLAALLAPICNLFSAEARTFYRWNCITFAFNLAITSLVLTLLAYYDIIPIKESRLTYSFGIDDDVLPENVMGVGSLVVLLFAVLVNVQEGLFAYWSCTCVHQNQKSLDSLEKRRPRSRKSSKKTVMNEQEVVLIADSWDLVRQDLKGHGLKFFKQ